jgi:periodic tryptophan protein 2
MTVRVYSRDPVQGFVPITLSGHRDFVRGCFFADGDGGGEARDVGKLLDAGTGEGATRRRGQDQLLYTVSRDGAVFVWKWQEFEAVALGAPDAARAVGSTFNAAALKKPKVMRAAEDGGAGRAGQWVLQEKKFIQIDHCKIDSVALNRRTNLLVVGFSSGIFGLYDMPSCTQVHTLSISQRRITAAAINATGEWIAFGSAKLGQLLVWEWQSETYVLKQQGHFFDVNALAYSPDGQLFVTGGDDGKVRALSCAAEHIRVCDFAMCEYACLRAAP